MGTVNEPSSNSDTNGVPPGRTLVLDEHFVEALSDDELEGYVDAVTRAASGAHADVDELAESLAADLEQVGMPMAPVQVKLLAEQLFGAQDAQVAFVTTGGKLLARHDGVAGVPQRPGSAADPEHPNRPKLT